VREATGWELKVSPDLSRTSAPTEAELKTLRELKAA
jgi:glutaconate CoA-transferase subunit B